MKYVRNCESCRRRKLKCDRVQPCGPCQIRKQSQSCHFSGLPSIGRNVNLDSPRSSEVSKQRHSEEAGQSYAPNLESLTIDIDSSQEEEVNRLAEIYFAEQDKGIVTYVISRSNFDKGRLEASVNSAWQSIIHAICGVAVLFLPIPNKDLYTHHFTMAEDLLKLCDTDRQPDLVHIRILLLLLVGLGPLKGPHVVAGKINQALYIAHVLGMHLHPSTSLSIEEQKDRILLYSSLAKADWFSTIGLDRTFYTVDPRCQSLNFFFGPESSSNNGIGSDKIQFDPSVKRSLQMASFCRRMTDRSAMSIEDSFAATLIIETDLKEFELSSLPPTSSPSSSFKQIQHPSQYLMPMMLCNMRRALHQPFYLLGQFDVTYEVSRDLCFKSAIQNLNYLSQMFANWIPETSNSNNEMNNFKALPIPVTVVWYHIYNSIRCALVVQHHLNSLQIVQQVGVFHDESVAIAAERSLAQNALESTRKVLETLALYSLVARDGLEALRHHRPAQSSNLFEERSANLDDLKVFDDDDGHDFWAILEWLAPVMS